MFRRSQQQTSFPDINTDMMILEELVSDKCNSRMNTNFLSMSF